MIEITNAVLRDASYVTANLRPRDHEEVYAQWPDDLSTAMLARILVYSPGSDCYTALLDGQPVAVFGTSPMTVNCMWVWALGTKDMRRAVPAMTRHFLDEQVPRRIEQGITCAEARSLATHGVAHRWIEALGGVKQGPAFEFGKRGEFFVLYRWTVAGYRAISAQTAGAAS